MNKIYVITLVINIPKKNLFVDVFKTYFSSLTRRIRTLITFVVTRYLTRCCARYVRAVRRNVVRLIFYQKQVMFHSIRAIVLYIISCPK